MALNQRYPRAEHITIEAPKAYEPGEVVHQGAIRGVALTGAEQGEKVTVSLTGSFDLPVEGDQGLPGQPVYATTDGTLTTEKQEESAFFGAAIGPGNTEGTLEIIVAGLAPNDPA